MEESLSSAFQLLWVGMLTVFVILFLVVLIGNLIIRFVNRFVPAEVKKPVVGAMNSQVIDQQKMAAIVSAVSIVTQGKGKVVNVERI